MDSVSRMVAIVFILTAHTFKERKKKQVFLRNYVTRIYHYISILLKCFKNERMPELVNF